MLIDSHVHVGQFYNRYFCPQDIIKLMTDVGVTHYAVASTSMCEEDYEKVLHEIRQLVWNDGERVLPIMWITPEGLKGNIAWFLESNIQWKMLKIHPFLNQTEWNPKKPYIHEVLEIARELNVPLLIHTGLDVCCNASQFEPLFKDYSDVTFILAHGEPIEEAKNYLKTYTNVYVDSAFMACDQMKIFIDNGLSHKLLWGTDMCIPKHFFPDRNMVDYYKNKLNQFRDLCTQEQFNNVTFANSMKIFSL